MHLKNLNINFRAIFLFLIFFISGITSRAQLSLVDVSISLTEITSTEFAGTCKLEISDSLDCSIIEVILLDATIDNVVFNREYIYDQAVGLPPGISWSRSGNNITLGLGTLPYVVNWNARVRLKDANGNPTPWTAFLFN
jgi:hypothetical protein